MFMQTALSAGLATAAPIAAVHTRTNSGIASAADPDLLSGEDAADHAIGGRRLLTSFVKRSSGKLSNEATAASTSKAGDKGSSGKNELSATSKFTLRIPIEEGEPDAGEFSAPFIEETTVVKKADKNGVTEDKETKTVAVVPAPRVPKGATKPKDGKVDFPRVPEDFDKAKGGKKDKKAVVEEEEEVIVIKRPAAKAKSPPLEEHPEPAPQPAPKKPPTARTRPRAAPRRGRETGVKPPSSGGSKVKAPKAPPVKEVKAPAPKAKKGRGESRFDKFQSTVKGRGTDGKAGFGFAVVH